MLRPVRFRCARRVAQVGGDLQEDRDRAGQCGAGLHHAGQKRGKGGDAAKFKAEESERLLGAAGRDMRLIALDERGAAWTSLQLAEQMRRWTLDGRDVVLAVGGPDGHAPLLLERAAARWSLSPLTLPHGLVRVVIAEQLYRAHSILEGHPYHRA